MADSRMSGNADGPLAQSDVNQPTTTTTATEGAEAATEKVGAAEKSSDSRTLDTKDPEVKTEEGKDTTGAADRTETKGNETERARSASPTKTEKKLPTKSKSFKPVSVNKQFLKEVAPTASSTPSTLSSSLQPKPSTSTSTLSAARPPAAPKLKLTRTSGSSGSLRQTASGTGGSEAAPVWNKGKQPPPPTQQPAAPSPKPEERLTDEQLKSRYGIHLASRLDSEAIQGSKWADIDDDDDDWVPQKIEWADGSVAAAGSPIHKEAPPAPPPPEPAPKPAEPAAPPAPPAKPAAPTTAPVRQMTPLLSSKLSTKPKTLVTQKDAPSTTDTADPPAPKPSPWAKIVVPKSPVITTPPVQEQRPRVPEPPRYEERPRDPYRPPPEVSAEGYDRVWHDRRGSTNQRELFNSRTGQMEPVEDAPARRSPMTKPAVLQRSSQGPGPAEPSPAFQQARIPMRDDFRRRRTSSNVSAGSSGFRRPSFTRYGAEPPRGDEYGYGRDRHAPVFEEGPGHGPPSVRRSPIVQHRQLSPAMHHAQPVSSVTGGSPIPSSVQPMLEQAPDPRELIAEQERIMREAREQARKRRLEEEAKEEAAKKERLRLKLEALERQEAERKAKEEEERRRKEEEEQKAREAEEKRLAEEKAAAEAAEAERLSAEQARLDNERREREERERQQRAIDHDEEEAGRIAMAAAHSALAEQPPVRTQQGTGQYYRPPQVQGGSRYTSSFRDHTSPPFASTTPHDTQTQRHPMSANHHLPPHQPAYHVQPNRYQIPPYQQHSQQNNPWGRAERSFAWRDQHHLGYQQSPASHIQRPGTQPFYGDGRQHAMAGQPNQQPINTPSHRPTPSHFSSPPSHQASLHRSLDQAYLSQSDVHQRKEDLALGLADPDNFEKEVTKFSTYEFDPETAPVMRHPMEASHNGPVNYRNKSRSPVHRNKSRSPVNQAAAVVKPIGPITRVPPHEPTKQIPHVAKAVAPNSAEIGDELRRWKPPTGPLDEEKRNAGIARWGLVSGEIAQTKQDRIARAKEDKAARLQDQGQLSERERQIREYAASFAQTVKDKHIPKEKILKDDYTPNPKESELVAALATPPPPESPSHLYVGDTGKPTVKLPPPPPAYNRGVAAGKNDSLDKVQAQIQSRLASARNRTQESTFSTTRTALEHISNSTVVSLPQAAAEEAAKKVILDGEDMSTIPNSEEFKEDCFVQEFGSSPTVRLPSNAGYISKIQPRAMTNKEEPLAGPADMYQTIPHSAFDSLFRKETVERNLIKITIRLPGQEEPNFVEMKDTRPRRFNNSRRGRRGGGRGRRGRGRGDHSAAPSVNI